MLYQVDYTKSFGLQIEDRSLRILEISKNKNGLLVRGYAKRKLAPGLIIKGVIQKHKLVAETIRRAMADAIPNPIKKKEVICSVPEYKTFVKILEMPLIDPEEAEEAVRWEAEDSIPLPLEKVFLDWKIIERYPEKKKMKVAVVAAPKEIILGRIQVLEYAGLLPVGFEPDSFALSKCLGKMETASLRPEMIIYLGERKSIVVIKRGFLALFSSSLLLGVTDVKRAILTSFGSSSKHRLPESDLEMELEKTVTKDLEKFGFDSSREKGKKQLLIGKESLSELLREIKSALNYFEEELEEEVEMIYLTGAGSAIKGMDAFLGKEISREILEGKELSFYKVKHSALTMPKRLISDYAIALGSALG